MSKQADPLPTCDPSLVPMVASRSSIFTPRRAADSSGRLGSFYDACCDQVVHNSNLNFVKQSGKPCRPPQCYIKECTTEQSSNLLKWLNMHYDLRLSIPLQMVHEMGVGALINYSRSIDKYTRFICYDYYSRTDYLSDKEYQSSNRIRSSIPDTLATHVIVLVNWGIDAIAVLQLRPDDKLVEKIDYALTKLCLSLSNEQTNVILSQDDKRYLKEIVHTEVFSNIPDLSKINSIIDFCRDIPRVKNDTNLLKPYNYSLCSIQYFYAVNNGTQGIFNELPQEHIHTIEHHLLQLSHNFKKLRTAIDQDHLNLQKYLKWQLSEMRTRWSYLEEAYMRQIQRLHDLVIGVRRGEIDQKMIPVALNNDKKEELIKSMDDFGYDLNAMQNKEHLIDDLIQNGFEYRNAIEYDVKNGDDKQTIACKLFFDGKWDRVFYFNDILRLKNKSEWDKLDTQLIKEHKDNTQLRIIYVDFSYSSYELNDMIILPKIENNNKADVPKQFTTSPPSERPKSDEIINILLLGESGVGKSTFINAFVNYLTFNTLEQAQKNPIVLIPISFVLTTDNDFKEQLVTFGGMDTLSNEDHDHPGQSVTQHCKSYIFTLSDGNNKEKKLRIIDTPGIGDVRGLAQDDINMQHILSYINNLTHLNAVCILMKPNNTRLNILFRSCFIQLFDLFSENARNKIIFCFTNSRATFYTPGNTAPLLKSLLQSLPVKDVPFSKENTFCFDSESFRYLVAIQNGIKFSESEEKEYKESWNKSSTESKRFLEYIRTKMTASLIPGECKSVKDAQLKISVMIRPILETMRNILRNIVLWDTGSRMVLVELHPRSIKEPTAICLTCSRPCIQVADFWITTDALHKFHNQCGTCGCSPKDHYPLDYQLDYKPGHHPISNSSEDRTKALDYLYQSSAELTHFLVGATDTSQSDLFFVGFERMIKEEDNICKSKAPCQLNSNLLNCLLELKKKYEETRKKLSSKNEQIQLSNIYDKIEHVSKYPMIESQMFAIKEWRKLMVKYYEYEVPT